MAEFTYTSDPALVTRVWVTFNTDQLVYDEDEVDTPDFDRKLAAAYPFIESEILKEFPNATDIIVHNAGWEGDMAQLSPRAEGENGEIYEPFFDWLDEVQSKLIDL